MFLFISKIFISIIDLIQFRYRTNSLKFENEILCLFLCENLFTLERNKEAMKGRSTSIWRNSSRTIKSKLEIFFFYWIYTVFSKKYGRYLLKQNFLCSEKWFLLERIFNCRSNQKIFWLRFNLYVLDLNFYICTLNNVTIEVPFWKGLWVLVLSIWKKNFYK